MDAGKRVNWTERRNEMLRLRRYWTTRQRTHGILGVREGKTWKRSPYPVWGVACAVFSLSPPSILSLWFRELFVSFRVTFA